MMKDLLKMLGAKSGDLDPNFEFSPVEIAKALIEAADKTEKSGEKYMLEDASRLMRSMTFNKLLERKASINSLESPIFGVEKVRSRWLHSIELGNTPPQGAENKLASFFGIGESFGADVAEKKLLNKANIIINEAGKNQKNAAKERELQSSQNARENEPVKPLGDDFQAKRFPDLFKALRSRNRFRFTQSIMIDKIQSSGKDGKDIVLLRKNSKFAFAATTNLSIKFTKSKDSVFSPKELAIIAEVFDIKSEAQRWNKDNDGVGAQGLTLPQLYYAKASEYLGLEAEKDRSKFFEEGKSLGHITDPDVKKINGFLKDKAITPLPKGAVGRGADFFLSARSPQNQLDREKAEAEAAVRRKAISAGFTSIKDYREMLNASAENAGKKGKGR